MKKIDRFLLKSFIGPFILIFFIALFILVMQFLWRYIDDLVGKGLGFFVLIELLFYASASLVPLALPLAMLLASMMTVGSFGEHYELTALKSSGASLFRILRSLLFASLFISLAALAFSNYVLPAANLKFGALLYDIRQQRPALNIKPGVFNNDIDGYSIRVGSKAPDGKTIYNVLIYDHTSNRNAENVLFAHRGKMYMTEDKRYLIIELFNGTQYQENAGVISSDRKNEQVRSAFKTWRKILDLSEFSLSRTQEALFKDNYQMMSISQLSTAVDTLYQELERNEKEFDNYLKPYFTFLQVNKDSIKNITSNNSSVLFYDTLSLKDKSKLLQRALVNARNVKGYASITAADISIKSDLLVRHNIEWHRKFTLSLACFLLFFIGAPLGAIIRKGGFGLPFVVSILFFVIYYMITISGEKFAKEFVLSAFMGMWLSVVVLFPMGLFLTYKASSDSVLFNMDAYKVFFTKIFSGKSKKAS